MNTLPGNQVNSLQDEETIDFKKIVLGFIDQWPWILASIIICCAIAFFYGRYTPPNYKINAKVLINSEKGQGSAGSGNSIMDFSGLIGSSSSADNEAEVLKTRFLMEQVVRQMQLNIVYYQHINYLNREIYSSPYKIDIVKGVDSIRTSRLDVQQDPSGKVIVSANDLVQTVSLGQVFKVEGVGEVKVVLNPGFNAIKGNYFTVIESIDNRVAEMMSSLTVAIVNKQVSIIDLELRYPIEKKGEDILNAIINRYIVSNLEEKNVIADSTMKFIYNRLKIISGDLGNVEDQQQNFNQNNQLADMSEQNRLLVQNTSSMRDELAKAETQLTIVSELEEYLKDERKNKRIFPTSLLPSDQIFTSLMNQYNSLLIERDRQLLSLTEESPFVKNVDTQIASLRRGIIGNIQSTKNTFLVTRDRLKSQLDKIESKIGEVPKIQKDYLKLARSQKIKEELYVFLMQKVEETAISKTSNSPIAKTIDPPKANNSPISPKKNIIYLVGLIVGLIVPLSIILIVDIMKTTVLSKEDITRIIEVPIIGEINHNNSTDNLIVANQSRSAISEQFRALRTNLSFYLKSKDKKVILLTSSMSGEGKSFTAINLGNIFALAGKKVLLMELDLRKPGLSAKLNINNEVGFSNYTIDSEIKIEHIVKPLSISKNMYIISSGPLPPNPAETLISEHTPILMEELKKQFDYIIMDAPPIGIISDAQLLSPYADVTLYIVRQRVTRKDQLKIVDELYKTGKMNNIGIVVNDIMSKQYGYGYGYGTYGINENEANWLQKMKNKFKLG